MPKSWTLIKSANYTNAATVEFILDQDNNFYFIEVADIFSPFDGSGSAAKARRWRQ